MSATRSKQVGTGATRKLGKLRKAPKTPVWNIPAKQVHWEQVMV